MINDILRTVSTGEYKLVLSTSPTNRLLWSLCGSGSEIPNWKIL